MKKIPFYLVTGFLGSGKTTLLKNILAHHAATKRIAVIQNEFAAANIDGKELQDTSLKFSLIELNQGSVFCVCLFSNFKETLLHLINEQSPDMIILEATGIADPIAIGQLLEDNILRQYLFLAHIWSVVDAPRFFATTAIKAVDHQIAVADTIVINKIDDITSEELQHVTDAIAIKNPFAHVISTTYSQIDTEHVFNAFIRPLTVVEKKGIKGDLTRCGEAKYESQIFKTTVPVCPIRLHQFLETLTSATYRLKGYVHLNDGSNVMVQYVPNHIQIYPNQSNNRLSELIAIGLVPISFELLNDNK